MGPFSVTDEALRESSRASRAGRGRRGRGRGGSRPLRGWPRAVRQLAPAPAAHPASESSAAQRRRGSKIETQGRGPRAVPLAAPGAARASPRPRGPAPDEPRPAGPLRGADGPGRRARALTSWRTRSPPTTPAATRTWCRGPQRRRRRPPRRSPSPASLRRPGFVHVEQNVFNAAFVAQGADPWIWDPSSPARPAGPTPSTCPACAASGGAVARTVGLIGGTDHAHTVEAFINGQSAGRLTFRARRRPCSGIVPAGALRPYRQRAPLTYTAEPPPRRIPASRSSTCWTSGCPLRPPTEPVPSTSSPPTIPPCPTGAGANYLIVTHAPSWTGRPIAALKEAEGYTTWWWTWSAPTTGSARRVEPAAVRALIRHVARAAARSTCCSSATTPSTTATSWAGRRLLHPVAHRLGRRVRPRALREPLRRLRRRRPARRRHRPPPRADGGRRGRAWSTRSRARRKSSRGGRAHLIAVDNQAPATRSSTWRRRPPPLARAPSSPGPTLARVSTRRAPRSSTASPPARSHPLLRPRRRGPLGRRGPARPTTAARAPDGPRDPALRLGLRAQCYQYDVGPSLNEALLLAPRAGALAAVGPAGITDPAFQSALFERLYAHFLAGVPLGEALRRAKAERCGQPRRAPGGRGLEPPRRPRRSPSPGRRPRDEPGRGDPKRAVRAAARPQGQARRRGGGGRPLQDRTSSRTTCAAGAPSSSSAHDGS